MAYPQYTEQQTHPGYWLQPQFPPQQCQFVQPVPATDALLQRVEACMATMVASNQMFQHTILQEMANLTQTVADVQLSQKSIADSLLNINSNMYSPQRMANSSSSSSALSMQSPQRLTHSSTSTSALSTPESIRGMDVPIFVDLCPFPQCVDTPTIKRCSAAHSLQHMQSCTNCPDGASTTARYLSIAEHMLLFAKQPRVSKENTCCWCGESLPDAQWNADAKSRHRKSCQRNAIIALKDADSTVANAMQQLLQQTWIIGIDCSPAKRKRLVSENAAAGLAPVDENLVETALTAPCLTDDSCLSN